jgi:hypothetical protein
MMQQSNLTNFLDYYERAHQNPATINRYVHHLAHSMPRNRQHSEGNFLILHLVL